MKTRQQLLATFWILLVSPAVGWAAQVTATDLVKNKDNQQVVEPVHEFKGPIELLNAAKRGDTAAQLEVAILYEYGFNMPDNEVYALAWYLLAADGSAKAVTHRDKLLDKLSPAEVERARGMSRTLASSIKPQPAPAAPETETPPAEVEPAPQNQ